MPCWSCSEPPGSCRQHIPWWSDPPLARQGRSLRTSGWTCCRSPKVSDFHYTDIDLEMKYNCILQNTMETSSKGNCPWKPYTTFLWNIHSETMQYLFADFYHICYYSLKTSTTFIATSSVPFSPRSPRQSCRRRWCCRSALPPASWSPGWTPILEK